MAIDNNALIGAPDADRDSNADRGAAYVYTQTGGTWTAVSELTPSVSEAGQSYGTAVAIEGSVAAISAPNAGGVGAVFVFRESGGTWTEDQVIVPATDDTTTYGLGVDIALADGRLIVGASSGTAYVYTEISSTFVLTETINVSGVTAADRFGSSVAITSDYASIGAFRRSNNGSRSGEAFVFRRAGNDSRSTAPSRRRTPTPVTDSATRSTWTKRASLPARSEMTPTAAMPARGTSSSKAFQFGSRHARAARLGVSFVRTP